MRLSVLLVVGPAVLLGGCGGRDLPTTSARVAERLPSSYSFVLTASCGERDLHGTYAVAVRSGEVVRARRLDRQARPPVRLDLVPTLPGLVALAEDAGGEAEIGLDVDDDGLPVALRIDHVPGAIDDEECYDVRDVRR